VFGSPHVYCEREFAEEAFDSVSSPLADGAARLAVFDRRVEQ
jgi:hypothetical protein